MESKSKNGQYWFPFQSSIQCELPISEVRFTYNQKGLNMVDSLYMDKFMPTKKLPHLLTKKCVPKSFSSLQNDPGPDSKATPSERCPRQVGMSNAAEL